MSETLVSAQVKNGVESQNTGLWCRTKRVLGSIHVEPFVCCYILSRTLMFLALQNLYLQKACKVNLHRSRENCTALENLKVHTNDSVIGKVQMDTQELVADMNTWLPVIQFGIPCVLAIFIGSWSDRNRKRVPFILLPMLGELIRVAGLLLCVRYFYETPMELAGLMELPASLAGGRLVLFNAVFSYVGDVTKEESKTLRIGIVNLLSTFFMAVGTAASGVIFRHLGFYSVFATSLTLFVVGLIYGGVFIKEVSANELENSTTERTKSGLFNGFFNAKHIEDAFKATFKNGPHNRKRRIIMLMCIVVLVMGPLNGEQNVSYLNTNLRFNWNEVDYSIFSTYSMVMNITGTAISVGLLSHVLKINDGLIGAMACLGKIVAGLFYTFATAEWMYYIGPIVDIMGGTVFILARSIMTKIVQPDELGQVTAIYSIIESLVPIIFSSLYNIIYNYTKTTLPGAYSLVGTTLAIPATVLYLWLYKESKKEEK